LILARLPILSGLAAHSLVRNLIELAFEAERAQRGVAFADLPPLQQRVVRALVELPGLWPAGDSRLSPVFTLFGDWMMSSQVPCPPQELRRQLRAWVGGDAEPGPATHAPGA
jgi:hypothetical protein